MAPFSKFILAITLTGALADYVAKITLAEEGEPLDLKWGEADDKEALAISFVQTHTGNLEGVSCKVGEAECFKNVLLTHMAKFEEVNGDLPVLNLGASYKDASELAAEEEKEKRLEEEADGVKQLAAEETEKRLEEEAVEQLTAREAENREEAALKDEHLVEEVEQTAEEVEKRLEEEAAAKESERLAAEKLSEEEAAAKETERLAEAEKNRLVEEAAAKERERLDPEEAKKRLEEEEAAAKLRDVPDPLVEEEQPIKK
jgi:hypothetical protein